MVNGHDIPISIDELHDKLLNRENTLASLHNATVDLPASTNATQFCNQSQHPYFRPNQAGRGGYRAPRPYLGKCQICGTQGHSAKQCSQLATYQSQPTTTYGLASPPWPHSQHPEPPPHWKTPQPPPQWHPQAHYTTSTPSEHAPWLLDSCASHHIASNLINLSLSSPYNGGDDVLIGDGSGLKITHTGSASILSQSRPLLLSNVLCVPTIKKIFIFVNKLCKTNNVMVQMCPNIFQVKNLKSGATMVHGKPNGGLHEWPVFSTSSPSSPFLVFSCVKSSLSEWHSRLGHPSVQFSNKLFLVFLYQFYPLLLLSFPILATNKVTNYRSCLRVLYNLPVPLIYFIQICGPLLFTQSTATNTMLSS